MVGARVIGIIGCGWLGLPLAERLVQQGHTVHGTTTTFDKLDVIGSKGIKAHLFDLSLPEKNKNLSWLSACDSVFIAIPPGRYRDDVERVYVEEINYLIDVLIDHGIEQVIYISSTGVYGDSAGITTEESLCKPSTNSAKAVFAAEQIIKRRLEKYLILRMAGLVGPGREPGRWFAGRKDIPNGDCRVNLVHLQDCLMISERLLFTELSASLILNVCADKHPQRRFVYREQSLKLGLQAPEFTDGCEGDKIVSNAKLKELLNYRFEYPDPMLF